MAAIIDLRRLSISGWLAAALVGLIGCQTMNDVKVDAISNPQKAVGTSYRLEVQDPGGGVDKELGVQAVAAARSALASRGLYEAPANTQPDMVITFEYGVGPGEIKILYRSNIDAGIGFGAPQQSSAKPIMVFEKYLALSARDPVVAESPSGRSSGKNHENRGEELWSVRVSVEDPKKDLAPYLVVLASGVVDYIGRNPGSEVHIKMDSSGHVQGHQGPPPNR